MAQNWQRRAEWRWKGLKGYVHESSPYSCLKVCPEQSSWKSMNKTIWFTQRKYFQNYAEFRAECQKEAKRSYISSQNAVFNNSRILIALTLGHQARADPVCCWSLLCLVLLVLCWQGMSHQRLCFLLCYWLTRPGSNKTPTMGCDTTLMFAWTLWPAHRGVALGRSRRWCWTAWAWTCPVSCPWLVLSTSAMNTGWELGLFNLERRKFQGHLKLSSP